MKSQPSNRITKGRTIKDTRFGDSTKYVTSPSIDGFPRMERLDSDFPNLVPGEEKTVPQN